MAARTITVKEVNMVIKSLGGSIMGELTKPMLRRAVRRIDDLVAMDNKEDAIKGEIASTKVKVFKKRVNENMMKRRGLPWRNPVRRTNVQAKGQMPKALRRVKDQTPKALRKVKDHTPKALRRVKDQTPKTLRKIKDQTPKALRRVKDQ